MIQIVTELQTIYGGLLLWQMKIQNMDMRKLWLH